MAEQFLNKPPCIGNLEPGCSMKSTEALIELLIDENRNLKYRHPNQVGFSSITQPSLADSTDVKILQNNLRQLELQLACGGKGMSGFGNNSDIESKLSKCKVKNKMLKASLVGFADCESSRKRLSEEVSVAKKLLADKMKELDDCKAQSAAKDVLIQQMSVQQQAVPQGGENILEQIAAEAFGTTSSPTTSSSASNLQPEVDRLRARVAELERSPNIPPDCVPKSEFDALQKRADAQTAKAENDIKALTEENISLNKANEDLERQLATCQQTLTRSINEGTALLQAESALLGPTPTSSSVPATSIAPSVPVIPPPSAPLLPATPPPPAPPAAEATPQAEVTALKELGVEDVTTATAASDYNQLWLDQKQVIESQADQWFATATGVLSSAGLNIQGPLLDNAYLSKQIEAKVQADTQASLSVTNVADLKEHMRRLWIAAGESMFDLYTSLLAALPSDDARRPQAVSALLKLFCFAPENDVYLGFLGVTPRTPKASGMNRFIRGFRRNVAGIGSGANAPPSRFFTISTQICNESVSATPALVRP